MNDLYFHSSSPSVIPVAFLCSPLSDLYLNYVFIIILVKTVMLGAVAALRIAAINARYYVPPGKRPPDLFNNLLRY